MKVLFIRKRNVIYITLILLITLALIFFIKSIRNETLSVLLNNEKSMPIYSVDVPDKRVALTFDTGWGSQYTEDILATLKRYNIKATFFVVGTWAEKYPDLLKSISDDNHDIGNHSLSHVKMIGLSKKGIISEVRESESKIQSITGKKIKLFRIPFGEYDDELVAVLKSMGYNAIQWDVDSLDWEGISREDILGRVVSKVSSGSIVLFHSNTPSTPEALSKIIEELRDDGYKFVTVSELLLKENYYIDNTGRQKSLK